MVIKKYAFRCFLVLWISLLWVCLSIGTLHAAPVLDLRQQDRNTTKIDIRAVWQSAVVASQSTDTATPLDAPTVWSWPDGQFAPGKAEPVTVRAGQRHVGRLSVLVEDSPHSLVVELPMPRLDVAHLSYRYNDGPWAQLSAGDQIAMAQWPFANRNPTFVIPPKAGELQIILEVPQVGLFPSPVNLWADQAFRQAHANRDMEAGASLALAFFSMLICLGAAAIFKRFVFFAVALYSLSVLLITLGQGGIIGIYVGTTSTWFNDNVKYASGIFFGAMVPWTVGVVVSQKYYSKLVSRLTQWWLVGSLMVIATLMATQPRDVYWPISSPFLIASLVFGFAIALASVLRGQAHAYWSLAAAGLICVGIAAPIAAFWGYLDGQWSYSVTMLSFLLSSALLLFTLLLQYRQGNWVIARAAQSQDRDALTGLLNRTGFERKLAQTAAEISAQQSHALFIYLSVSDTATLEERFGGEGFESGMLQIAAALSASISVVDTVSRVGTNAFAITVVMEHDAARANALAQKIITRTMAISTHSTPVAHTARIAMAWMPVYGRALPDLEKLAKKVLRALGDGKRIGWVGGAQAHAEKPALAMASKDSVEPSSDNPQAINDAVHSVINRVEREMEQERLQATQQRAERLVKVVRPPH